METFRRDDGTNKPSDHPCLQIGFLHPSWELLCVGEVKLRDEGEPKGLERMGPGRRGTFDPSTPRSERGVVFYVSAIKPKPAQSVAEIEFSMSGGPWMEASNVAVSAPMTWLNDQVVVVATGARGTSQCAYLRIVGSGEVWENQQWQAQLVRKDGKREASSASQLMEGTKPGGVEFRFDSKLGDVDHFVPVHRPIHTFSFTNVKIPPFSDAK